MPPCTFGCRVLTRPSSISGNPVTSEISRTGIPVWRKSLAVPPVEISSTPKSDSLRAKSAKPVLSVTLRTARAILADICKASDAMGGCSSRKFYQQTRDPGVRDCACLERGVTHLEPGNSGAVSSDFGSRPQLHLAIFHFDQVLDFLAAVFFADLFGFLFHERTKVGQRARNLLSGFFLGIG